MIITGNKQRGILWLLVLLTLPGLAMVGIPFLLTPPAFLHLRVKDSVFNDSQFQGKTIEVTNAITGIAHPFKINRLEGNDIVIVGKIDSGTTHWRAVVDLYHPMEFKVKIPPMQTETVTLRLKPRFGRLKIITKNTVNAKEPINTPLKLKLNGTPVSNVPGARIVFSPISAGHYSVDVEAAGFYPSNGNEASVSEGKITEAQVLLTPKLKDNEAARIVLRWHRDPRDLDSHLFLPANKALTNRHIFFPAPYKKAFLGKAIVAQLDVDDTTSFGPETVTIYRQLNGLYHFAVRHFAGTGTIGGTSRAEITVFTHEKIQKFLVPADCRKRWWYVLKLNITDQGVTLKHINRCPSKMGWSVGIKQVVAN